MEGRQPTPSAALPLVTRAELQTCLDAMDAGAEYKDFEHLLSHVESRGLAPDVDASLRARLQSVPRPTTRLGTAMDNPPTPPYGGEGEEAYKHRLSILAPIVDRAPVPRVVDLPRFDRELLEPDNEYVWPRADAFALYEHTGAFTLAWSER